MTRVHTVVLSVFGQFSHGKLKGRVNPLMDATVTLSGFDVPVNPRQPHGLRRSATVREIIGKFRKDAEDTFYKVLSVKNVEV